MRKTIMIMVFLICLSFCLHAETGVVEFKYWFQRVVANAISDIYFTDTNKNRISAYEVNVYSDLSTPQVFAAVYTNKTSANPYTITLTFKPMKPKNDSSSTFHGQYKAKVYRLINNAYTEIPNATVTVGNNPSNTYSTSFTGDYSSSNDITTTFYYPIAFLFDTYIDTYANGAYEGTIRIEAAAT